MISVRSADWVFVCGKNFNIVIFSGTMYDKCQTLHDGTTHWALPNTFLVTSFRWLVFFFGVLLWGSMIHKHTGRWMWQGSASVVSWSWEKYSCHSKLILALSMLLLSVLSWRVSQAWNTCQIQVSPGTWACDCLKLLSTCFNFCVWCQLCCLSSVWSFRNLFLCYRLWRLVSTLN